MTSPKNNATPPREGKYVSVNISLSQVSLHLHHRFHTLAFGIVVQLRWVPTYVDERTGNSIPVQRRIHRSPPRSLAGAQAFRSDPGSPFFSFSTTAVGFNGRDEPPIVL